MTHSLYTRIFGSGGVPIKPPPSPPKPSPQRKPEPAPEPVEA